jgi:hypothetical protein
MTKTLYIFEPNLDFNLIDPTSILLDHLDIDLIHNKYHTSLGDLSTQEICQIADQFDLISFVEQGFNKNSNIFKETVILLNFLQHRHTVINFTKNNVIDFISDQTIFQRPDVPVLWVFGCSHSHGKGLDSFEQCYSSILSKELNLPLKSITQAGSSLSWSFRHLMQANIRSDDLVVWQLTTPERFTKLVDFAGQYKEVLLKNASVEEVLFWSDLQLFYQHVNYLNIGLKFLRNLKVKAIVTSLDNASDLYYRCLMEYTKHPEYCYLPGHNVDIGNDNIHFGPLTHQNLANGILKFLSK